MFVFAETVTQCVLYAPALPLFVGAFGNRLTAVGTGLPGFVEPDIVRVVVVEVVAAAELVIQSFDDIPLYAHVIRLA